MIRRIRIDGYKSFKGFDLKLQPISVIFGPNAAGKSNLLDAIYFVSRSVSQRNLNEAFEAHRGLPIESFYYGDGGYEALLKKDSVEAGFLVDVEISDDVSKLISKIVRDKRRGIASEQDPKDIIAEKYLRYELKIEILPKEGYLRVINERLCALRRNGAEKKRKPFLDRRGQKIHLRMEGQAHPIGFELGLDHTVVSSSLYEPHYPHVNAFKQEVAKWQVYYLEPKVLMREEVPVAKVKHIGPRGENLAAFLNTLKARDERIFEVFNLAVKTVLPQIKGIELEFLKDGRVGFSVKENKISFSSRLVSEGTLRFLGLMAALHPETDTTVIGYEEPENGVHPVRLGLIAELIKRANEDYRKQIIVTTHSAIFPEYFENKQLFVCRKEGHITKIEPFEEVGPIFKRSRIVHALEDSILRGDYGG